MAEQGGGDLFKGFLLGSFFGVITGLLFAPKSGKDTRDEIVDSSDELLTKARNELDKIKDDLGDLRNKLNETLEKGKVIFEQKATQEEQDFEAEMNSTEEEPVEKEAPKKPRKRAATKKADKEK